MMCNFGGASGGCCRCLRLHISCRRGHQKPHSCLIAIKWVSVQIAVQRKYCHDPVHALSLRKIELLRSTEIVDEELQINGRSDVVVGYTSGDPKTKLRS